MLLPVAIIVILLFIAGAGFIILRKTGGKTEINRQPRKSGTEKRIMRK
jgi:F0F1-type ATP synthase assembly protein I